LEVHELVGVGPAQTRLQAVARRGLTRFLGRDSELARLRQARQLAYDGRGQVSALVAEAGTGKSRLVYEFAHSHQLHGWLVLECTAVSYGRAMSYRPVIDLLKSYFEIQDQDDLRAIGDKVTGKVLALDRRLEPTLPALLSVLDVPVEPSAGSAQATAWLALAPAQRRQRILDALRRLLLREARKQPLLVIFEDLHWIDGETQALLDDLVANLGTERILLLVTYRPEYAHSWGSKTYYGQMRLGLLSADRTMALLDALLGDDAKLGPLKQLLVKRGNPFFLEEIVQTLVETKALEGSPGQYRLTRPVDSIQVPATVQVMLAARIDRLPLEEKRLLHIASVIGKRVPFTLLQAVAEMPEETLRGGLDHLQAAEFVYDTGPFPDLEYTFKHALTHDVAYGTLLNESRCELHASIVNAIEALYVDRLGEHIEQLAHHALRGELREKAVSYLRQAALKSVERSALHDAKAWFEQALGVLQALPENQPMLSLAFEIRLELRPVLMQLGEARQMVQRLREAEILAERLSDDRLQVRAGSFLTSIQAMLGELDKSLVTGTHVLEVAGCLGDWKLNMLAAISLGQVHYLRGNYVRTVELLTDSIATIPADLIYDRLDLTVSASVYSRYWLIVGLTQLGAFDEATMHGAEAIRLAISSRHAYTAGLAYFGASRLHLVRGDWANPVFELGIEALRTANVPTLYPYAVSESAWVLAQLGKVRAAFDRIREGEKLLQRQLEKGYVSQCSTYWGVLVCCLTNAPRRSA
jgi:tetratricopeptide (TPR) repeat protein